MLKRLFIIQCIIFCMTPASFAETLVLIHGYLSDSSSWHKNKTTYPLQRAGWVYAGNYSTAKSAQLIITTPPLQTLKKKGKVFVTVDLPADAPIELQAGLLGLYLNHLYKQRQEALILVGHSAGGVVSRAWLTLPTHQPTKALITIASPHLGTPLAQLAALGATTPLNEMGRVMGMKNFRKSKAIFSDLKEESHGNYLYWLNRQKHPAIQYLSIIRNNQAGFNAFDYVVPKKSQNMNNVWALRGHSAVLLTGGDHFLSERDGAYIRDMIEQLP